jgi:hypothetical protein
MKVLNLFRFHHWLMVLGFSFFLSACGSGGGGNPSYDGSVSLNINTLTFSSIKDIDIQDKQIVRAIVTGKDVTQVGAIFPPGVSEPAWIKNVEFLPLASVPNALDITITVDAIGLPPGEYNTTLRIAAATDARSVIAYQDIQISLKVEIKLAVVQKDLLIEYMVSTVPTPTPIDVVGDGIGWTASTNQAWLKLDRESGFGRQKIQLNVETAGLQSGEYSGQITLINAQNAEEVIIKVSLKAKPRYEFSLARVDLSAVAGSRGNYATVMVRDILKADAGRWTVGADQPWIRLAPHFTTPQGASGGFGVAADASGLIEGNYDGVITLTDSESGYSVPFLVKALVVPRPPSNLVSPLSIPNSYFWSYATIDRITQMPAIEISSTGAPLQWKATANSSWIKLSSTEGITPGMLVYSVDTSGLSVGSTYSGLISVSSFNGIIGWVADISVIIKAVTPIP